MDLGRLIIFCEPVFVVLVAQSKVDRLGAVLEAPAQRRGRKHASRSAFPPAAVPGDHLTDEAVLDPKPELRRHAHAVDRELDDDQFASVVRVRR